MFAILKLSTSFDIESLAMQLTFQYEYKQSKIKTRLFTK